MYQFRLVCSFMCCLYVNAQDLTGEELLEKAIQYHDPNSKWHNFNGNFQVTMQTPNSSDRISNIHINLPEKVFLLEVKKDDVHYEYHIEKDSCTIALNGSNVIPNAELKKHNLSCERANMYKNYYTYLYGLPMKLKDPGTKINPKIQEKKFKGKTYLVLKTTYEQEVGNDTWYFYFDPETYAMKVYQFFHEESKNDGEYILLSDSEEIDGIKMPKIRKWYYNIDNSYLGSDILEKVD